jgi:heme/copper-type cytochrome/quinol oxidase subunit 2
MARTLIIVGLVLVAAGLLWPVIGKLGLGRLPGDIHIEGENYSFYFPLMTSLLISIVLSVIFLLANR